ncbi:MAG: hypothetical protein KDD48_02920, partial [Bdellovibrionales bacterium]|nr:hypothetical protein [Bdellovibrionales bacterium]
KIAKAVQQPGGMEAIQLQVAEQYVQEFGRIAKASNTMILPANLSDLGSMLTMALGIVKQMPTKPQIGRNTEGQS